MRPPPQSILTQNRLLTVLPQKEYERLTPHLEPVHLRKGEVLYEANDPVRYAFFPSNGIVSLLLTTEEGEMIEVGMIGNEGVTGLPVILRADRTPYLVVAQLPVEAVRIKAEALKSIFDEGGQFQHLLLSYTHVLFTQVAQSALCNRFHTVEERLCRWLLEVRDRAQSSAFDFTHEFIAQMLGAPRSGVSMAAGALQRAGLIRQSRGRTTILDGQGLEAEACECYQVIKVGLEQQLVT